LSCAPNVKDATLLVASGSRWVTHSPVPAARADGTVAAEHATSDKTNMIRSQVRRLTDDVLPYGPGTIGRSEISGHLRTHRANLG
jgi:hypothetical protein